MTALRHATSFKRRPALPSWYSDMVCRMNSREFQILGLPDGFEDRTFPDRQMAEDFITANFDALHKQLRRGPRLCMCCPQTFISMGRGHRLCADCRNGVTERKAQ